MPRLNCCSSFAKAVLTIARLVFEAGQQLRGRTLQLVFRKQMKDWARAVGLDKSYRILLNARLMDCISLDRSLFPTDDNAALSIPALLC